MLLHIDQVLRKNDCILLAHAAASVGERRSYQYGLRLRARVVQDVNRFVDRVRVCSYPALRTRDPSGARHCGDWELFASRLTAHPARDMDLSCEGSLKSEVLTSW